MAVALSAIGYFLPIFAFLLVFVVVFAILKKTELLEGHGFIVPLISFILASFFIVQTSLVDFVQIASAWVSVVFIIVFFFIVAIALIPGKFPKGLPEGGKSLGIIVSVGLLIIIFLAVSGQVFKTVVNWALVQTWIASEWFGMILLLLIAVVVANKIKA